MTPRTVLTSAGSFPPSRPFYFEATKFDEKLNVDARDHYSKYNEPITITNFPMCTEYVF